MKTLLTYGEKYLPAMTLSDQAEADAYFEECVQHYMHLMSVGRAEAEECERRNLGWFAGYFDNDTRARVERLFRCAHPIFGAIAVNGPPTPEQAFEASKRMAEDGKL